MKNMGWMWTSSLLLCFILVGCAGTSGGDMDYSMPTVDYVEGLNVNDAPHQESFLNQLAMNYRSYALYNARTSGHPDVAELFAQKAVSAFSGETPFPETLDNWRIEDEGDRFDIYTAYNELINEFKNDAIVAQPQLAAEAQAKYDCWISATASGQRATAEECEDRFQTTMEALRNCDRSQVVMPDYVEPVPTANAVEKKPVITTAKEERYYPETRRLSAMTGVSRSRDGIVIINNVNVPGNNLVQPVPVPVSQPKESKEPSSFVFNQNITGGSDTITNNSTNSCGTGTCNTCNSENGGCNKCSKCHKHERHEHEKRESRNDNDGYVTREEFIDLMLALRSELNEINARLDGMMGQPSGTAPLSVPVSVNVTTPANQQQPQGQPVIVNTTTPAPIIMTGGNGENPPVVVNTSASAVAPAAAPANINVSNTTASASKTDPINVGVSSASKTDPINLGVSSASKTDPVNVGVSSALKTEPINVSSASKTDPVNATSASASKTDPVNVSSGARTEPINVSSGARTEPINLSSATAPSPVSVNTSVPAQQMQRPDKTIIKVQQIPNEPRQRIMEEILEIRFDFDKATIKPEYENVIRQLAAATQANRNIKVSVVGHTDTAGSAAYNYALGGRRAEAVQKMLIAYGIPASQIIAVSAGEEDLKVPTPNNTPNAENRRVRVVKEVQYTEQPQPTPLVVEEYSETEECDECEEY